MTRSSVLPHPPRFLALWVCGCTVPRLLQGQGSLTRHGPVNTGVVALVVVLRGSPLYPLDYPFPVCPLNRGVSRGAGGGGRRYGLSTLVPVWVVDTGGRTPGETGRPPKTVAVQSPPLYPSLSE